MKKLLISLCLAATAGLANADDVASLELEHGILTLTDEAVPGCPKGTKAAYFVSHDADLVFGCWNTTSIYVLVVYKDGDQGAYKRSSPWEYHGKYRQMQRQRESM